MPVRVTIENERWKGTKVRLRAGKALAERRKGVILHFHPPEDIPRLERLSVDELMIGIDGSQTTTLRLAGTAEYGPAGEETDCSPAPPPPSTLTAYGNVLFDILSAARISPGMKFKPGDNR